MSKEIEQFEPLTAKAVKELGASSTCDLDFLTLAPEPFARAQRVYRLCGHETHQECGSHSSGFRLVGYRQLEHDVLDHDAAGNAIQGPSNGPRWRQREVPDLGFAAFDHLGNIIPGGLKTNSYGLWHSSTQAIRFKQLWVVQITPEACHTSNNSRRFNR